MNDVLSPGGSLLAINAGSTSLRSARYQRGRAGWLEQAAGRLSGAPADMAERVGGLLDELPPESFIAHRVVHGGERYSPVAIDETVLAELATCTPLAPLHQPAALTLIRACREQRPDCRQLAVFDSLPFADLPPEAADYALPGDIDSPWPLRRRGFHGLAHLSMRRQALAGDGARVITLQLGGGVSLAAWQGWRAVDTSMGLTPLEGPVMATRSGDVDPGLLLALLEQKRYSVGGLTELLYRESGLRGLSGGRGDDPGRLLREGSAEARQAVAVYCHRLRRYIGAFVAVLGGCDELVLGGGVGENQPEVRAELLRPLSGMGLVLDEARNSSASGSSTAVAVQTGASTRITVVPVDEAAEMLAALESTHAVPGG